MKRLLATLIAGLCAATSSAQTIKSLGYNSTNGVLVAATNVVWSNSFSFSTNTVAAQVRTNLGLGATSSVTFNTLHADLDAISSTYTLTIGQTNTGFRGTGGGSNDFVYARQGTSILGLYSGEINSLVTHRFAAPMILQYGAGSTAVLQFGGADSATGAAISRTNLGLPLAALTNTSNVTALRALSGSSNTNEPYSGSVSLTNTNTLVFSNGILQSIQ